MMWKYKSSRLFNIFNNLFCGMDFPNMMKTKPKKQPAGGIEPPIYRLRSGCLATWPYRLIQHIHTKCRTHGSTSQMITTKNANKWDIENILKKNVDPRGNRTPNLRVWNPTRYHCAMESIHIRLRLCAQWIEHQTSNLGVAGSSPAWGTFLRHRQAWPSG